jgi:hypothetical protein
MPDRDPSQRLTNGVRSEHEELQDSEPAWEVCQELRAFVSSGPPPDLVTPVMRRVQQLGPIRSPASRAARLVRWFWTAREVSFRLRPAYAVLGAALAAVVSVWGFIGGQTPISDAKHAAPQPSVFVQFRLDAPGASHVQLAGSFTNWEHQLELHEVSPGIWQTTLLLQPGVHDYSFVVDGDRWVPDPYAPTIDDGFGGANSRLSLVLPAEPRS